MRRLRLLLSAVLAACLFASLVFAATPASQPNVLRSAGRPIAPRSSIDPSIAKFFGPIRVAPGSQLVEGANAFRLAAAIHADDSAAVRAHAGRVASLDAPLPDFDGCFVVSPTQLSSVLGALGLEVPRKAPGMLQRNEFYVNNVLVRRTVTLSCGEGTTPFGSVSIDSLIESYPIGSNGDYQVCLNGAPSGTPLGYAVKEGRRVAVGALVAAGAKVDAPDSLGVTALMRVARGGEKPMLQLLLGLGADVKRTDGVGMAALHHAAGAGRADMTEALLAAGAPIEARDRGGMTPLIRSASAAGTGALASLLAHGAQVDARDARARTALMHAASAGSPGVIRALVAAHADVNATDEHGMTPLLCCAAEALHPPVIAAGDEGVRRPTYGRRSAAEVLPALKVLLSLGADRDARDGDGNTALLLAARHGNTSAASQLLDAGASQRARNHAGQNAMALAKKFHHGAIRTMLAYTSPWRLDVSMGGDYGSIAHEGQVADLGWEVGAALSIRLTPWLSVSNGLQRIMRSSDIGSNTHGLPRLSDGRISYDGYFAVTSNEYVPALRFDLPPHHGAHFYALAGLTKGTVGNARLVDEGFEETDVKAVANTSTSGTVFGGGVVMPGIWLEVRRYKHSTDAFKKFDGKFGTWSMLLGFWY